MIDIDIIIPTFHSKDLVECAIGSFERFRDGFNFRYIVVENSSDVSYKSFVSSMGNVLWVQNDTAYINSEANAMAYEAGLKHAQTNYVFLCHVDTMACHENWMKYTYYKAEIEGNALVGYRTDAGRIRAIHQAGILVRSDVAKAVSMFPVYDKGIMVWDVGDSLTAHCRDHKLPYFCCKNSFDSPQIIHTTDVFRGKFVDRALDNDGNVIFMHLGRGIVKMGGQYNKEGRVSYNDWLDFGKQLRRS